MFGWFNAEAARASRRKAFQRLRVLGQFFGQELQCDKASELKVFRLVNHTHSAAAELFDDPVMRDILADHIGLEWWVATGPKSKVESLRTLDRLRRRVPLTDVEVARRRSSILRLLDSFELVEIDRMVLDRASQPLPTDLGTLDAIHLATSLLWRESRKTEIVMATHDRALAIAAQSHGFYGGGKLLNGIGTYPEQLFKGS